MTVSGARGRYRVLLVGGAGYIGSHMVRLLVEAGHEVLVLDNLSTGHADALRYGESVIGDMGDADLLDCIMSRAGFDCVMHFASYIEVGESVRDPGKYYHNNVTNTHCLIEAMVRNAVPAMVFSSTAAVYGEPRGVPIAEDHPIAPINPYGRTKATVEGMLADYDGAHGLRSVALRYFNAAGAHPQGNLGERHDPETHLIPLVLRAASGRRDSISLFGTDYPTADGSAIRDYIHVIDLCTAHLRALEYLMEGGASARYNLGNGQGFSVREVIDAARTVTGRDIPVREEPRRPGDPAVLVADSTRARTEIGWQPEHTDLQTIIRDAWAFEQTLLA